MISPFGLSCQNISRLVRLSRVHLAALVAIDYIALDYILVIVDKQSNLIALLLFPAAVFINLAAGKNNSRYVSPTSIFLVGHGNHKFLHAAEQSSDGYAANEEFQKLHQYCAIGV